MSSVSSRRPGTDLRLATGRAADGRRIAGLHLLLVLAFVVATTGSGATIATESFEYTTGSILGRNGGAGFSGAYSGSGNVTAGSLSYTDTNGRTILAASNRLTTISLQTVFRDFNTNGQPAGVLDASHKFGADGSVIYVGLLCNIASGAAANGYGGLSFFDGATEKIFFGDPGWGTSFTNWAVDPQTGSSNGVRMSAIPVSAVSRFLVGRIDFGSGVETIRFYVDPPLASEPAAASVGPFSVPDFRFTRMRIASGGLTHNFDEIRIGTTYADAVGPLAPTIVIQPQSQVAGVGSSPAFSVTVNGSPPLKYQWFRGGTALPSATNATLTINNVSFADAGNYSVVVSNVAGAVTSDIATLSVFENVIELTQTNYVRLENSGSFPVEIRRAGNTNTMVTVRVNTFDETALANGGALASLDYAGYANFLITFNPGETSQWVWILIADNALVEGEETFRLELAEPSSNAVLGARSGASVLIVDDDTTVGANPGLNIRADSLVVQPDGKMVLGGGFNSANGIYRPSFTRLNPDGSQDTSFNLNSSANDWVTSVAVHTNSGKIVIGGYFTIVNGVNRGRIAQLDANGSLDTNFVTTVGANAPVYEAAVQPDGKVVLVGAFTNVNGAARNHIARLNTNGTVDLAFDPGQGLNSPDVWAVALQPDGKILVGGYFSQVNGSGRTNLVRFNSNGAVDTNFVAYIDPGGTVNAIHLQPDGKILLGGYFISVNGVSRIRVARLLPDGALDASFNAGGGPDNTPWNLALQPDGKILVGGFFLNWSGAYHGGIVRLLTNGVLDTNFNIGPGANGSAPAVGVLLDGRIVAAGDFTVFNGYNRSHLVFLNPDGSQPPEPVRWRQWRASEGGNNHWYALTSRPGNWTGTRTEALSWEGHLATVNSAAEQAFLERTFLTGPNKLRPFWIGLNDAASEGNFVWSTTGEPVSFTKWSAFEPAGGVVENYAAFNWHYSYFQGGLMPGVYGPSILGSWNDVALDGLVIASQALPPFFGIMETPVNPYTSFAPSNTVWIPPGTFTMGSPAGNVACGTNESPQTLVTLTNGFWIGQSEVTQGQYLAVVGSNPSRFTGDLNQPVEQVSWSQAMAYCAALTARESAAGRLPPGYAYRLPTEAEWEYAARAGTTTHWSFGNDGAQLGDYGWFILNSGCQYTNDPACSTTGNTHPVGEKLPNPWGLYDIHGNVGEWCLDYLGAYPGGSITNPIGSMSAQKIFRAPAWDFGDIYSRSACRWGVTCRDCLDNSIGFRVVLASIATDPWVAFNDHAPSAATHPGATTYHVTTNVAGFLRDITTGINLPAHLSIQQLGVTYSGEGSNPAPGTPAYNVFNGYVDLAGPPTGPGTESIQLTGSDTVVFTFSGLDSNRRYRFISSAVRGEPAYTNRWTLVEISGAQAFEASHTPGVLTSNQVPSLGPAQAALNTGINHTTNSGDFVGWAGIQPATDGTFSISCHQYTGPVPGGNSASPRGYGLDGIRLAIESPGGEPPTLIVGPVNQSVIQGGTVQFRSLGFGTGPLTYQWRRNGIGLPGATNATLVLTNVITAQAGDYSVRMQNPVGTVTSITATLKVFVRPAITVQPQSQTVVAGGSATFFIEAAGTEPLSFRWRRNLITFTAGTIVSTPTNSMLTLTNVSPGDNGAAFSVVVTNIAGILFSSNAVLTVVVPPSIVSQPLNQTVPAGGSATFSAEVNGSSLRYQWFFNGTTALAGATNVSLTINNVSFADAGLYHLVASNVFGVVTSAVAQLTISCAPPPAGLVAWWPGDGNANDVIGTNHGSLMNGATFVPGKVGQAFSFDGISQNVQIPDAPHLNPASTITLGVWVYVTGKQGQHRHIISKDGETFDRQYLLAISPANRFRAHVGLPSGYQFFDGSTPVQLDTWYHVAMTYDGAFLKLYVNGVLDGFMAVSGAITITTQPVRIGGGAPAGQNVWHFQGFIDEPSLYNRALSSNEIAAIYATGSAGMCPPHAIVGLSATNGGVGSEVVITGANFSTVASNNIVYFGTVRASVISATATQLVVTVPPGASYAPISVTVNGLTTASRLPFSVTFASRGVIDTSLFAPPVVFGPVTVMGLGQLIERSVVGDMDGDGRNDVVLSCRTGPTGPFGLQVFLNQSSPGTFNSGSLGSGILIDSGSGRLGGLYVADVDGDGQLDLVARRDIAESNPQCDVYRNVSVPGSLAFAEKITVAPTNGLFFAVVGAGDLEGDGRPDLLGLSSNLTYFVLRNIGAPGNIAFEPPVEIISPCCALEDDPRLTDLDGDGKLEIVLAEKNARQVAIFQNIGPPGTLNTGSFAAPVRLPLIGGENRLQIADIDRDGRPDIVVTSGCTNFVTVFRNLSAPRSLTTNSFATGVKVSVGGAPLFLAIADFDGDGRPDIATGNCATNDPMCGASCHSNTLSVLRNLSEPGVVQAGSFAPPVSFAAGNAYPIPHAIDMDNNGVPDLVVGTFTGYFSVWRNTIAELCVLAPSGLVAWWKGEGNANDVVGTNHGTLLNGAGFGPGKAGQAFSFDGTDDYVYWPTAPALDLPGSFSLSLWGNANSLTGNSAQRYLFADFGNDGNVSQGSLGISNGRFGWLQSTTDAAVQRFSASSLLQTGVWYHVAVVRDDAAKQVRLYVNGVEEGQTNYSGRMVVPLQGRRVLGASGPEFDDYFAGRLDELAIFNRALTAEEIAAIYAAGASGFCPKAVILVNGHLYPSNNITVVDTAVEVVVQSSFSGGTMLYSLDGSPPNTGPFYTGPIILTESAIVRAIAFSSDFTQSVEADPVTITVLSPPVITAQPMGRTAILGENVQFDVVARGTPPLSYQWWRNGNPIPGATAASLLLGNVNLSDSGNYLAVVSNAFGVAISAEAMLTVLVPAGIVAHPAGTNVAPGGEAIFCVMAEGTEPVRFQWRKNGVRIPGATNACFTITNVQVADGGIYNVVAANVAGVATSGDARLVVNVPPRPPGNDLAERVGISNAIGSVSGTNFFATSEMSEPNHAGKVGGSSVWYKWRAPFAGVATFGTRGSTFDTLLAIYRGTDFNALTNVASDEDSGGFGTSELRYNTEEGVEYAIAIDGFAGAQGDFVLSWSLVMVTEPLPVITVQPQSRTVAQGSDVSFSVTAEGNSLSYQWILNGITITNATNTIYTVTNAQPDDVGAYVVRVSNTSTQRVESQPAFLEIGPPEGGASKDKFEDLFSAGNQPPGFTGGKRMLASTPGSASSGFLSVSMGTIASQTFNNIGATTQAGEPQPCTVGGSSKWFGLRPTADGTMEIDTLGSSFDTLLAVFTGTNSIETLRRVDCDDNGAPDLTSSLVRFPARRGTNYSILVDGVNGAEGIIQLNWRLGTLPTFTTPTQTVQSLRQGDSLLLEANAGSATADLSYRWYLNTQLVAGADSPQLVLTNLQPSQAGAYRVVAQNFAGSITGIVASVTVAEPIQVTATLVLTNGVRMLRLTGGAGRSNVIEASSNLSTWVPVHTNISEYGPLQFLEPASTNLSQRFYRVLPWR